MIINFEDAIFKALITVTYPSGTCTVTHKESGVSYSHSGGGTYTFAVHRRGEWDIEAVDGTRSNSDTTDISQRGQIVSKTLSYELVLFDSSITSGWKSVVWAAQVASGGIQSGELYVRDQGSTISGALVHTQNSVNTSGFTKAKVTVTSVSSTRGYAWFVLQNSPSINTFGQPTSVKSVQITGTGEYELTQLPSGSYYVGIIIGANEVRASRVWLE